MTDIDFTQIFAENGDKDTIMPEQWVAGWEAITAAASGGPKSADFSRFGYYIDLLANTAYDILEDIENEKIGRIVLCGYQVDDPAYLLCDGSFYSPEDYPKLFTKIGYEYGESPDDGFAVPVYKTMPPYIYIYSDGTGKPPIAGPVEPPTEPIGTSLIAAAIAAARNALANVVISADGTDVTPDKHWVTQAMADALNAAIDVAKAAKAAIEGVQP